jgi:hypothetical protein
LRTVLKFDQKWQQYRWLEPGGATSTTFNGFHLVFTEDEIFDKDKSQKFKDDYFGTIVSLVT